MKELESLDAAFVIDTFLLLLIGIGPKIALVPFLDMTAGMTESPKRRVRRKMLTTAALVAALLLILGGVLTRLLHFSPGALGVASGIILLIIAASMVLGQGNGTGGGNGGAPGGGVHGAGAPVRGPLRPAAPARCPRQRPGVGRGRGGPLPGTVTHPLGVSWGCSVPRRSPVI